MALEVFSVIEYFKDKINNSFNKKNFFLDKEFQSVLPLLLNSLLFLLNLC